MQAEKIMSPQSVLTAQSRIANKSDRCIHNIRLNAPAICHCQCHCHHQNWTRSKLIWNACMYTGAFQGWTIAQFTEHIFLFERSILLWDALVPPAWYFRAPMDFHLLTAKKLIPHANVWWLRLPQVHGLNKLLQLRKKAFEKSPAVRTLYIVYVSCLHLNNFGMKLSPLYTFTNERQKYTTNWS